MSQQELTQALVRAGWILGASLLLVLVLLQLRELLAVLFIGCVLGVSLNPTVQRLSRFKLPQVAAVLLVYAVIGLALALVVYFAARELGTEELSFEVDELRASYDEFQSGTVLPTSAEVESGLRGVGLTFAGGLLGRALSFITAFLYVLTILFTALLFTVTQDRLRDAVFSFIDPDSRDDVHQFLHKLAEGLRRFMVGELMAMVIIGVVTYVGLLLIGMKLPLGLAFLAFLFEVLPLVGPWIAFLPALAIALTDGIWMAVKVGLLYLAIQGLENYVVTPLVHGRESQIPALLILVALLFGGSLMGVLGALVALPLAVIAHITFFEVIVPWNQRRFAEASP